MHLRCVAFVTSALALGSSVQSQTCNTTTLLNLPPSDGSHVALQTYSYCGGNLNATAYIHNDDYNKVVTLFYSNVQDESTPLTSTTLNYQNDAGNGWELWGSSTPVWIEGITRLLNVTYQDTDAGASYVQALNLPIEASGDPPPSLPSPPEPYATPTGFGDDITSFLAASNGSQAQIALARMFRNINPAVAGANQGVVVAGQSGPSFTSKDPDYEYNWVRDSSLTMNVVYQLYEAAANATAKSQYENVLFQYAAARAAEQNDPNLQTGLGEPKFNLDNTIFTGPWGRPQNDGPATSAITLIQFADTYLANGGDFETVSGQIYSASVQKDLLYVASEWSSPSFDLWEEEESDHFYTKLVQRRALILGAQFATRMNDSDTSATLTAAEQALSATLARFWDEGRQILLYEYGPVLKDKSSYLDISVVLGLIHGYADDGVYSYTSDQVQSTVVRLATSFIDQYPIINQTQDDAAGAVLGIAVGRYPEDVYTGTGTKPNGGNPWYLCTAAMAQYMWTTSGAYSAAETLSITNTSSAFFDYFAPGAGLVIGQEYSNNTKEFQQVIDSLNGWGDAFMRTVKYYTPADGSLAEEYHRDTGVPQGCSDLTWSYASILTAAIERATIRGQTSYVQDLANVGFTQNQ